MTCHVDGCSNPVKVTARQLCNAHYIRQQRAGTLTPLDLFASRIYHTTTCWLWTGGLEAGGYGKFGGKLAHRISWERVNGPIPDGMTVDHICRNRACVNPAHLRLLPPSENFSDNGWRGRRDCANGHQYTPENTRLETRNGYRKRVCRACDRERQAKSAAKRKGSRP